jgi:pimeloyl-ACP methyl ester carboxylesterase
MWRGYASLADRDAQQAFVHTLRTIVDGGGQRVSATDRLYLAAEVPTLIVWGEADRIIPVTHGIEAQQAIPGSRLEVFERAGHFPHRSDPDRFADLLIDFVEHTVPADVDDDRWRELLRAGASA